MVHGLAGCVRSPYLSRVGLKLYRMGLRVVRMNLRGAGSGYGRLPEFLPRRPVGRPAGRRRMARRPGPGSPIAPGRLLAGGEPRTQARGRGGGRPDRGVRLRDRGQPADRPRTRAASTSAGPQGRVYDRNFIRLLRDEERRLRFAFPELIPSTSRGSRNLFDFDDAYTAPRNGFRRRRRRIMRGAARLH